jgi:hypothetical protein
LKRGNGHAVLEALAPHREALVGVVVESTPNWYWLVGLNYIDDD